MIVERQDANAQAYRSDVTAKMLLSGQVPPPEWADYFIRTLESCTGLPGNRQWVDEQSRRSGDGYIFGGVESPRNENGSSRKKSGTGNRNESNTSSYFDRDFGEDSTQSKGSTGRNRSSTFPSSSPPHYDEPTTDYFSTKFESDFSPNEEEPRKNPRFSTANSPFRSNDYSSRAGTSDLSSHKRSVSAYTPSSSLRYEKSTNPFDQDSGYGGRPSDDYDEDVTRDRNRDVFGAPLSTPITPTSPPPKLIPKAELTRPLQPYEGVARAIALYDFKAVQVSAHIVLYEILLLFG